MKRRSITGAAAWSVLSDDDLEGKLAELAAIGAPHCDTRRLADMLWRIEDIDDVRQIIATTTPSGKI